MNLRSALEDLLLGKSSHACYSLGRRGDRSWICAMNNWIKRKMKTASHLAQTIFKVFLTNFIIFSKLLINFGIMQYLLLELIYYSAEMKNIASSNTCNCSHMCSHRRGEPKESRRQEQESGNQRTLATWMYTAQFLRRNPVSLGALLSPDRYICCL